MNRLGRGSGILSKLWAPTPATPIHRRDETCGSLGRWHGDLSQCPVQLLTRPGQAQSCGERGRNLATFAVRYDLEMMLGNMWQDQTSVANVFVIEFD